VFILALGIKGKLFVVRYLFIFFGLIGTISFISSLYCNTPTSVTLFVTLSLPFALCLIVLSLTLVSDTLYLASTDFLIDSKLFSYLCLSISSGSHDIYRVSSSTY